MIFIYKLLTRVESSDWEVETLIRISSRLKKYLEFFILGKKKMLGNQKDLSILTRFSRIPRFPSVTVGLN